MTKAWMLRQDGASYPVNVHLYVMGDDDLSSEAEVAAFLIHTDSDDTDLAYSVLDAWMAMLIENSISFDADESDIDELLLNIISSLPYKFSYPISANSLLSIHKQLNNYYDVDSLYEYIDSTRDNLSNLQQDIRRSLNQQFCRVRYGGRTNSTGRTAGPIGSLWFRISSVGYNWANTIYLFVSEHYRGLKVNSIFICRDYESDNGDDFSKPDYFYKAKDGVSYYDMPIDEYLAEDHEHSPVFSSKLECDLSRGVIATVRQYLNAGGTFYGINRMLSDRGVNLDDRNWGRFLKQEQSQCIDASTFLDDAGTRTKIKISAVSRGIERMYPFIKIIDVDSEPRPNRAGKMVGFTMSFVLSSDILELNRLSVDIAFSKPFNTIPQDTLIRAFSREFKDYCSYKGIDITGTA